MATSKASEIRCRTDEWTTSGRSKQPPPAQSRHSPRSNSHTGCQAASRLVELSGARSFTARRALAIPMFASLELHKRSVAQTPARLTSLLCSACDSSSDGVGAVCSADSLASVHHSKRRRNTAAQNAQAGSGTSAAPPPFVAAARHCAKRRPSVRRERVRGPRAAHQMKWLPRRSTLFWV